MVPERRRPTGALQSEVLAALWASHPEAVTPAEVQEDLGQTVSYSTITTILNRLRDKGLVERERRQRGFVYRAVLTEAELVARRMQAHLDDTRDRAAALSQFVGALSPRDERALRRIIRKLD